MTVFLSSSALMALAPTFLAGDSSLVLAWPRSSGTGAGLVVRLLQNVDQLGRPRAGSLREATNLFLPPIFICSPGMKKGPPSNLTMTPEIIILDPV